MEVRLEALCEEAARYVEHGANILILSDRNLGPERVAMPSLLAVAAVHHHLVRRGTRLRTGLVIESGEPRDIHHMATLIGYGAAAINPYVMFESLDELADRSLLPEDLDRDEAEKRIVKAIGKGLLKTISKMGISTIQSYCGAQIFEAVGLERELIDRHFTGTASRIGGIGLEELAQEAIERHFRAYPRTDRDVLPVGGVLQWRRDGELHVWNPDTIAKLQHAVRGPTTAIARETYDEFARLANEEAARKALLRGLMTLRRAPEPMPLEEVEPATQIVKRFTTGAMSLGALSREAHETLAIAMNRIGGKSNTGEGGEDPSRYSPDANGDLRRSAIKQVASGRFGVNVHYLVNADQLQIKMAQGAKPGEGGQLPGHKVDDYIARIRNSTPGVGLISPPPHHDIYSIEDLKQLIYDLRCANPTARCRSSWCPRSASARWRPAWPRPTPITSRSPATTAARAPRRSPRSRAPACPGRSAWPRRSRRCCSTICASRITVEVDGGMRTGRDVVVGGAARGRRVRLLDRAADRDGLHHDARLPPQHLPGRDRHPGSRAAPALPRHPRAGRQLPDARRRGGARDHGLARDPPLRGHDRPHRAARHATRRSTTGRPAASTCRWSCERRICPPSTPRRRTRRPRARCSTTRSTGSSCGSCAPALERGEAVKLGPIAGAQRQPHRRRDPVRRDRAPPRRRRAARGRRSRSRSPARPARASPPGWPRA